MPSGDIEAVKQTLAAWIGSSRFTDALAAVDAAALARQPADIPVDDRATPAPSADAVFSYERAVATSYPACTLIGQATSYESSSDAKIATHKIAVVFTQVGDDEAIVTRDIERLVLAARNMFWRSVLDVRDGLRPLHVEQEEYSQLAPGQEGRSAFLKGGALMLSATTIS